MLQIILASLLSGGAAAVIVASFSKFLGDRANEHLRGELAAELEKTRHFLGIESRKIQVLLDRQQLVNQARFEAEFSAMKEVHAGITNVQMCLRSCRPTLDISPQKETQEERWTRFQSRANALGQAHDAAAGIVEALRPFYVEHLYTEVTRCLVAARTETQQIRTEDWGDYRLARENVKQFETAYSKVLAVIRNRVDQLSTTTTV